MSQVFQAPDAHTAEVKTPQGVLRVATSPSKGEMAVDTRDLASLDDQHVYQLWAIVDGDMTSAGLVEDKDAGAALVSPDEDGRSTGSRPSSPRAGDRRSRSACRRS